jgi:hypothetical protein
VYNLKTKKVVVSKDVRVDESIYGFTGKPVDQWIGAPRLASQRPDDREVVDMPVPEGFEVENRDVEVDDM